MLADVGLGDEGVAALASLVNQGRMEHLEEIYISDNKELTEQRILSLARAIDARGLPMLETFAMMRIGEMTARGIGAIAYAVPATQGDILDGLWLGQ